MVRNFRIVKVWPWRPTRFCKNSTGPEDVNRTARAINRKIGTTRGSASRTQMKSNTRFVPDCGHELVCSWTKLIEEGELNLSFRWETCSPSTSSLSEKIFSAGRSE